MPVEKPSDLARRLSQSGQGFAPAPTHSAQHHGIHAALPPPATTPDELAELREQLHHAQQAFSEATAQLDALQEARERAAEERRAAQYAVDAAVDAVRNVRAGNKSELVWAYLNNAKTQALPLAEAEQQRAGSAMQQANELEHAIESEIAHARYRLDECRRQLNQALVLVVSRSPELLQLWQSMQRAWRDLRSLRIAFLAISGALNAHLDGWYFARSQADEPLDRESGYEVDETLIQAWVEGITALRSDHTARAAA